MCTLVWLFGCSDLIWGGLEALRTIHLEEQGRWVQSIYLNKLDICCCLLTCLYIKREKRQSYEARLQGTGGCKQKEFTFSKGAQQSRVESSICSHFGVRGESRAACGPKKATSQCVSLRGLRPHTHTLTERESEHCKCDRLFAACSAMLAGVTLCQLGQDEGLCMTCTAVRR